MRVRTANGMKSTEVPKPRRSVLSNRHADTHTHTDRQTKDYNPRCACAPRVNKGRVQLTKCI